MLLIKFRAEPKLLQQVKLASKLKKSTLACLRLNPNNPKALYLALIVNVELKKKEIEGVDYLMKPEECASRIKNHKYLQYLAWAEIYLNRSEGIEHGKE